MARYFTFAIECYHENDALRLAERLRPKVLHLGSLQVPMAAVHTFAKGEMWYVTICPKGPGYSPHGYGEGMNEPQVVQRIIDQLYDEVSNERGVRRALCGYEAQDAFEDGMGNPELLRFDIPDLIYDRSAAPRGKGAQEFGSQFYRNPSHPPRNS